MTVALLICQKGSALQVSSRGSHGVGPPTKRNESKMAYLINQRETRMANGRSCVTLTPPSQGRTQHLRNSSSIPRLHLNHGVVFLHGVATDLLWFSPGSPIGAHLLLHAAETTAWERRADRDHRCPPSLWLTIQLAGRGPPGRTAGFQG